MGTLPRSGVSMPLKSARAPSFRSSNLTASIGDFSVPALSACMRVCQVENRPSEAAPPFVSPNQRRDEWWVSGEGEAEQGCVTCSQLHGHAKRERCVQLRLASFNQSPPSEVPLPFAVRSLNLSTEMWGEWGSPLAPVWSGWGPSTLCMSK